MQPPLFDLDAPGRFCSWAEAIEYALSLEAWGMTPYTGPADESGVLAHLEAVRAEREPGRLAWLAKPENQERVRSAIDLHYGHKGETG